MTRHQWIRYHVTLRQAILYSAELTRRERLKEFKRQQLLEVIYKSMGGDFEADRSLISGILEEGSGGSDPPRGRQQLANWIELADALGGHVPDEVRELARGR